MASACQAFIDLEERQLGDAYGISKRDADKIMTPSFEIQHSEFPSCCLMAMPVSTMCTSSAQVEFTNL